MINKTSFSENSLINITINNIIAVLFPLFEEQKDEIAELTAIGKALGSGKDISVLLEMILAIARKFTKADGGTLYLVDTENQKLNFHVIHNDTFEKNNQEIPIHLPAVSLYNKDHTPNLSNVSSYVFHSGEIVNIDNVYKSKKYQIDGIKKFDKAYNYQTKSMNVIPMRNHENDIIGILQLINSKNPSSNQTIPFSKEYQEKAAALANIASVILTQQMLIVDMKKLFEDFIKALAVSIDEKSKHTGGHIQRVTELCLMIAQKINEDATIFKETTLSSDQIDELRIAALMHDTGKITTPDHLIGKSTKLETIYDRIEMISLRWDLFKTNLKLKAAEKKLSLFDHEKKQKEIRHIQNTCDKEIALLEKEFLLLSSINSDKNGLNQTLCDQLESINKKSCIVDGKSIPYLTKDELKNLSISHGTLTSQERDIMNNHASVSKKILNKLSWPKKMSNIPVIAGAHHEKLDGSGYPLHLKKEELNLQSRILTIADIFEALSALDRPYKNPMKLSQTETVLKQMGDNDLIDKDIIKIFFNSNIHIEYAKKHLDPSQFDL
ncbi:MAG: HD domain-containing protein [Desulfobacteraceae bacterium]|nr:HD domain-containing protein [Desulfobacteraceae bacterium]